MFKPNIIVRKFYQHSMKDCRYLILSFARKLNYKTIHALFLYDTNPRVINYTAKATKERCQYRH